MSFPKAKINRFNEVQTGIPSPTRYDPKLDEKTKGNVSYKSDSLSSSKGKLDAPSNSSTPFRTPMSFAKKHSCCPQENKPPTAVVRRMTFNESVVSSLPSPHKNDVKSESQAKVLADFKRQIEQLSFQSKDLENQNVELNQKIVYLEAAKSELECILSNNRNNEVQVQELLGQVEDLKKHLDGVQKEKAVLVSKCKDEEDANVQFQSRITDLERKIEQVSFEYHEKVEEIQKLACHNETMKDTLDSMLEKVASLDRQIKIFEEHIASNENAIVSLKEQVEMKGQALMEKDLKLKALEVKHSTDLKAMNEHWESQLKEAEAEASRRQSAQLEAGEMLKAKYEGKILDLEISIGKVLQEKAREAAIQCDRYRDVCQELSAQTEEVVKKDNEVNKLSGDNLKLTSKVGNLIEEIKLLNAETTEKTKQMDEINIKFKEEALKNEKLSEQLGELDFKVANFTEELKGIFSEKEELESELRRTRENCNTLKLKNLDLQLTAGTQKETISNLTTELANAQSNFNSQLIELSAELGAVKSQCRKFEIVMVNTRNSLDAIGKRLIESEAEVERLNAENEALRGKLLNAENERNNADNNYRMLMDVKIELEQRVTAAETAEQVVRSKLTELELKNCDLELSKNELQMLKESLEDDKNAYEHSVAELKKVVNEQDLKMIQLEQDSLNHIEEVSKALMSKLEAFEKFSADMVEKLNRDIRKLTQEKEEISRNYKEKSEQLDDLATDNDILKTTFDIAINESNNVKKQYEEIKIRLDDALEKLSVLITEKENLQTKVDSLENENSSKECHALEELKRVESAWKSKWEKLHEAKEAIGAELMAMTDKKDFYKQHCQRLEKQMAESQSDRDAAIKDFDEIHHVLNAKETETASLKKRVGELETLIGPFREQLQQYETERMLLENDREQLRKQHLDQAAKLGHQNQKQKIQHVVKLKHDLLEMRKENQKLQLELKSKNRVIETLREEVGEHPKRLFINGKRPTSTPFKGKENDERSSPVLHLKQETMSPSNPLRDRNY